MAAHSSIFVWKIPWTEEPCSIRPVTLQFLAVHLRLLSPPLRVVVEQGFPLLQGLFVNAQLLETVSFCHTLALCLGFLQRACGEAPRLPRLIAFLCSRNVCVCVCVCVCVTCSVVSNSLRPHGLKPTRLLCPWDFPGKNPGVGCHSLLQGIFPTQGLNPGVLDCRQILYCLRHQGNPRNMYSEVLPSPPKALIKVADMSMIGFSSGVCVRVYFTQTLG